MSHHFYCRVLLFHFVLFNEYQFYNAQNSETNDNTSHPIVIQIDNNRQFFLNAMKITWVNAVSNCEQNGMTIGEVKTMNEAQILSQKMLKIRPVAIENAWIGGYKSSPKNESTAWKWLSNGEKIENNSDLWTRPVRIKMNSDHESTLPDQHCLLLDWHFRLGTNPSYAEAPCDRKREFICQTLNQTIIKNPKSTMSRSNSTSISTVSRVPTTHDRLSATLEPTYSKTILISAMKPLNSMNTKKKRKKKKVKDFAVPPTTTITATIEDEYLDYRMWELGKAQMKLWKEKNARDHWRKLKSDSMRHKSESVQRLKVLESNYGFARTQIPNLTPATAARKPLKPLKLYYAFEGPMVGGLTATRMPHEQLDGNTENISARRYHKYISRRRYNQYMAKKHSRGH